jgi:dihydrolipoamide dehydrogenase
MKYDVAVIGSGPGGYVAAIRCAQLGMKAAIIERYATLGGTCLNVGCIPSKALLDSSEHYYNAKTHFEVHGIKFSELSVDWKTMLARKDKVVADTCAGVDFLMKKNKIERLRGHATFLGGKSISIVDAEGTRSEIEVRHAIIATGSKPAAFPFAPFDKKRIISSTEALSLKSLPKERGRDRLRNGFSLRTAGNKSQHHRIHAVRHSDDGCDDGKRVRALPEEDRYTILS